MTPPPPTGRLKEYNFYSNYSRILGTMLHRLRHVKILKKKPPIHCIKNILVCIHHINIQKF